MLMSVEICDLKRCSRCGCTLLLKYFETNRKGELFKLCIGCRGKHKEECKRSVRLSFGKGYTAFTCECGETITEPSYFKAHAQSDKHRKYLHDKNIEKERETQTGLPEELKHIIKVSDFQEKQNKTDAKSVCTCKCILAPTTSMENHIQTLKHKRWLAWVEQGLDPMKEELKRNCSIGVDLQRERHRMYMEDHRARRRKNERGRTTEEP